MTEQTGPNPLPPAEIPAPRVHGRLKWRWAGDIVPRFWEPGLIDGVLNTHGMTIVYGPAGTGKTAVVVDIAGRIAAGLPWRGRHTDQGLVVYVAAEGFEVTENRIWGWSERAKVSRGELPLIIVETGVQLGERDVGELTSLVKNIQEATGVDPKLIIVDTLARTMSGDENSTQDMNEYVRWSDELREATGSHLMVVHHTGKDESRGARGSSALRAATDHEIEVYKDNGNPHGGLRLSKIRDGELEGTAFGFMLDKVVMGDNMLGRPVTTVVALETDDAPAKGRVGASDEKVALVKAYLRGQGGRATLEELRAEIGPLSTGNAASDKRAWKRLISKHFRQVEGYVVLAVATENHTEAP